MKNRAIQTLGQYDPTRTTVLRQLFARAMRKRFDSLCRLIKSAIVDQDVFGMQEKAVTGYALPGHRAFDFPRSQDKIVAFMNWLDEQIDEEVLEMFEAPHLGRGVEKAWTNKYIYSAYQKGVYRANYELRGAGYNVPNIDEQGGIDAVMNQPIHADRLGLLYTRVYEDLKGITSQMSTQISRVLTQGMAEGRNPREIAEMLVKTIKGGGADLGITDILGRYIPAKRRAEILARTEIIRAHHVATITEYENWKIAGVTVKAELATAMDDRVCERCAKLEGKVFSLKEARNLIPVHPQCYDDMTEVYTDRGWMLFRDLEGDEKILSLNPETLDLEWLPYIHKIEYYYNGKMIRLKNDKIDLLITPDHSHWFALHNLKWGLKPVLEIIKYPTFFSLTIDLKNGNITPVEEKDIQFVEYAGMVYDVELPRNHVLWVRRNGKSCFSGNCRCICLPLEVKKATEREKRVKDRVARQFKSAEHIEAYLRYRKRYAKMFEDNKEEFAKLSKLSSEKVEALLKKYLDEETWESVNRWIGIASQWQKDTNGNFVILFKYRASQLEEGMNRLIIPESVLKDIHSVKKLVSEYGNMFTELDYIRIRALNQAYLDFKGIKKIKLYRGTDGREGKRFREILEELKRRGEEFRYPVVDNTVAGYTDDINIAHRYGAKVGGITVEYEFDSYDVIIHRDFLSGLTGELYEEGEYIMKGLSKELGLNHFHF